MSSYFRNICRVSDLIPGTIARIDFRSLSRFWIVVKASDSSASRIDREVPGVSSAAGSSGWSSWNWKRRLSASMRSICGGCEFIERSGFLHAQEQAEREGVRAGPG